MMQYQIKPDGEKYINVYKGEEPKPQSGFFTGDVVQKLEYEHRRDKWLASAKSYRIKDEFVEEIEKAAIKASDTTFKQSFEMAAKQGITLPLSIAERIEIKYWCQVLSQTMGRSEKCGICNCEQYVQLKPLAVEEYENKMIEKGAKICDCPECGCEIVNGFDKLFIEQLKHVQLRKPLAVKEETDEFTVKMNQYKTDMEMPNDNTTEFKRGFVAALNIAMNYHKSITRK